MKLDRPFCLALNAIALGMPGWAAQHDQHEAHHPASFSAVAGQAVRGMS